MLNLNKIDYNKLAFFRFKKLGNKYLLTNEVGEYIFLKPELFEKFLAGKIEPKSKIYQELKEKNFIGDQINRENLVKRYHQFNRFLLQGPSLHIIVLTLRCNYKCLYCHANSRDINEKGFDMDISTAKKAVDTIFESPSKAITIEFQGGEPLLNWKTIKFIIEYAKKKNKLAQKDLRISLVSNFSLLNQQKLEYFFKKRVSLCTSLDGPEFIHNKNRIFFSGNSYGNTVDQIKKISQKYKRNARQFLTGALPTITKYAINYPKEIIDEYVKFQFHRIHLRPVDPMGRGQNTWNEISYEIEEFLNFYKKALDYIIELNLKGKKFCEETARIMLNKILLNEYPCYLDLRSPCGAGIGQVLYNYDGKVYTCDEGRMAGEDLFLIGDVKKDNYHTIISHSTVKSLCVASCLDNLSCDYCVYKPYCGVCPVINWVLSGSVFSQISNSEKCKLHKGILDYLFVKLQNKQIKKVFTSWLN